MKPARFDYFSPTTVDEAAALLAEHGDEARILAGGQSLVPMMNLRLAQPRVLVDINRIGGLGTVESDAAYLSFGATVRQGVALVDESVSRHGPLLVEAIRLIGHPQNRARGTVVGSLAHHDPAAELPAVAVALGATVTAVSVDGKRSITAEDFFVDHYTTALDANEMAAEVRFPSAPSGTGAAFEEVCRREGDFALVGVAAQVTVEDGEITDARVALAAVAGRPVRARKTETALRGARVTSEVAAEAAQLTTDEEGIEPMSDIHAPARYRLSVLPIVAERAISKALSRALAPLPS